MKTSLNIPDNELKELMKECPELSRTDAVVHAVREFNRRRKIKQLSEQLGKFDQFINLAELKKLRKSK